VIAFANVTCNYDNQWWLYICSAFVNMKDLDESSYSFFVVIVFVIQRDRIANFAC